MRLRPKTSPEPDKNILTRNFLLLFMAHFFFGFSFWPYVLLPVFLQDLGADLVSVGMMMGTASIAGIISRPSIGIALDRVGRRKCLLVACFIVVLANLSYHLVNQIGWEIYAVRLLHGLGMGTLMATFFTIAVDIAPAKKKTQGVALFGMSGHLSGIIAVPLGEQILRLGGYDALFMSCAGFAFVSMMISVGISEPETLNIHQNRPYDHHIKKFLKLALTRENRIPLVTTTLFALGMTSYMVFLKPYVREVGLGLVTFFFVAYSITAVLIRLIGGGWPDRFGLKKILYPALISMSTGLALLPLWTSSIGLLFSGILCGIGHGFIFPILPVILIKRAPDAERGGRMALFTLFFDIGIFMGGPFWGWIAKENGYHTIFFLSAAILLISWQSFIFLDEEVCFHERIHPRQ